MKVELKRRTYTERIYLDRFLRIIDFKRSVRRKRKGRKIAWNDSELRSTFRADGILRYNSDWLTISNLVEEVVVFCNMKLSDSNVRKNNRSGKDYLRHIMRRDDFAPESPVMKLAFNKNVVSMVADLIGDFPVISDIALLYSPPQSSNLSAGFTGSQNFHMDADDTALCKLWVILQDVGECDGPTVIVRRSSSLRIAKILKYKKGNRVKIDSMVTSHASSEDILAITGNQGDVVFIDTANVFHYGSRVSGASKGRFLLMISYSTGFAMEHGLLGKSSPMREYCPDGVDTQLNHHARIMLLDSRVS